MNFGQRHSYLTSDLPSLPKDPAGWSCPQDKTLVQVIWHRRSSMNP